MTTANINRSLVHQKYPHSYCRRFLRRTGYVLFEIIQTRSAPHKILYASTIDEDAAWSYLADQIRDDIQRILEK